MIAQKTSFVRIIAILYCALVAPLWASAPSNIRTVVQQLSTTGTRTDLCMQLLLTNKQIGEALYSYTKGSASLSSLFINEAYRNQGYGSKLFRLVCSMLKKKGCTELLFNVCSFESNRNDQPYDLPKLVSFFEQLGAEVVKYQDYVHGMPTTAVMTINL